MKPLLKETDGWILSFDPGIEKDSFPSIFLEEVKASGRDDSVKIRSRQSVSTVSTGR